MGNSGEVSTTSFDSLVNEAVHTPIEGWDFSYLTGSWTQGTLPWGCAARGREILPSAPVLLDMDTGGGERLAKLARLLPSQTYAADENAS